MSNAPHPWLAAVVLGFMLMAGFFVKHKIYNDSRIARDTARIADALEARR